MRNKAGAKNSLQRKLVALAVVSCFAGGVGHANPVGPTVVNGQVTFNTAGSRLSITNSPGSIINWQGFSIGANELTRFVQQSASSAVLNRVTGGDPSVILGALQSNGRVFLINPSGIMFGTGAQINTAGLVASTLGLSDADFLGGRYRFTEVAGSGGITNQGSITTSDGGRIYLVAPSINNSGLIRSDNGEILLAAGKSVELVSPNSPDLRVQINAPDNQVVNVGRIIAQSGRIGIYGGLIRQGGVVNADSAVIGSNGKIEFKATKDVTLDADSSTTANGPQGGNVTIQSDTGTTLVSGSIEAKGDQGTGGQVRVLGNLVGLTGNAGIDASGASGGGAVLIGGDRHGDNPDVQNAWRTYVGPAANVKADAMLNGDGGKIIVWSNDTTRYYGNLSARGGARSGGGGFAEVSGKESLIYRGTADLGAPNGGFGTLLLDPRDITIQSSGSNDSELTAGTGTLQNGITPQFAGQILFADPGATDFTLTAATVNAANANIVLQAQRDINVSAPVTLANDRDFVAQAGRDINVTAALTTNGVSAGMGNIHLEADSPHSGSFFDGDGRVNISAPVNSCGGLAGGCAGGNITLIGGGNSSPGGGFNLNANVQAGNGGINVALSDTSAGTLNFFIGAGGNTQLSSNDTGFLLTTGPLVLGTAATAGADGYGTGSIPLLVNSLSQLNASPMTLSTSSGSSFTLTAGSGGITLDRALTTFQPTAIITTGAFTLNAALNTTNNDLVITASTVDTSGGSITTGTGIFGCTGTGCPTGSVSVNQWNVDAGGDWMIGSNWSLGAPPTSTQVALLDRPLRNNYNITLGTAGQSVPLGVNVGALINYEKLFVTGNAANPTTLNISSGVTYNGSTASFNNATMSLDHAILGGSGTLVNLGNLALANSTVAAGLNQGIGGMLTATGGNLISGPFALTAGIVEIQSGTTALSGNSSYAGSVTVDSGATLALTGGTQSVYTDGVTLSTGAISGLAGSAVNVAGATVVADAGTTYSADVTNVSLGALDINGTASTNVLNLSGGSVGGTGSLAVSSDYNRTAGSLGTTFTDLALSRSLGAFNVGTLGASHDITLTTIAGNDIVVAGAITAGNHAQLLSSGAITLNSGSSIIANGTGDALVLSDGSTLTNNAGVSALVTHGGRWLVWSGNPASDNRGGLAYNFKQYNATYGVSSVLGTGNGFLYTAAPTVTPILTGTVSKVYDATTAATLAGGNYTVSGAIDSDTVTLNNPVSGSYDTRNVGTGKNVGISGIGIAGASDGAATVYGYRLSGTSANANIGTITTAALALNAVTDTKVYDGGTSSTGTVATSGLVGGDTVTALSQSFASKNVLGGNGSTLNVNGGYAVNDGNSGNNYTVTLNSAPGTITQAPVNLAASRRDDGTTNFTAGSFGAVITGTAGSETLTIASGNGTVPLPIIGTQTLTTGTLALGDGTGGGLASNYTLAGGAHTGTIKGSIVMPPPVVTPPPSIVPPPDAPAIAEASTNYVIYATNTALPLIDKVTTVEPLKPITKPTKQLPICR